MSSLIDEPRSQLDRLSPAAQRIIRAISAAPQGAPTFTVVEKCLAVERFDAVRRKVDPALFTDWKDDLSLPQSAVDQLYDELAFFKKKMRTAVSTAINAAISAEGSTNSS